MRSLFRFLAAVAAFMSTAVAVAATGSLTYVRPTTREDNSPLPASEIANYEITCTYTPTGGSAAPCSGQSPLTFPGASLGGTVTFTVTADGQACFVLRTVDTGGRRSIPTNPACKAIVIAPPNPPTGVTVAVNLAILQAPVYSVTANNTRGGYFGMIDLGKPCQGPVLWRFRARNFREVNRSDVYFWGSTQLRVAAPCA